MIVLEFIITAVVYLAFPVVYMRNYGKLPKSKARRFAIINSVVCAVIVEAVQLTIFWNDPNYVPNFLPAVFYYFIANAILKEKEDPNILK